MPVSSSYRGTVFTTHSCYGPWCLQHLFLYLRNKFAKHCVSKSINPSIEGQPLQPFSPSPPATVDVSFNPSIEGQPLQRQESICKASQKSCFNPSIEGQPLQPEDAGADMYQSRGFQSLYRGTAFATGYENQCKINMYCVSIPLSRDSLCNGY